MNDINLNRTIAIVGHNSSGKTSLAESLLFNAKEITRLGKVDEGNTVADYDPEEIKRKISINTSLLHYSYKKYNVNLIDTPGDDNFFFDVLAGLRVVDGVIMVTDAVDGIKGQGKKIWKFVYEAKIPSLFIVNKMDREYADFYKTLEAIKSILKIKYMCLQLPIIIDNCFRGVVDLLSCKSYMFNYENSGKTIACEIPSCMIEKVYSYHKVLTEDIAEIDDDLMERYLSGEKLKVEELVNILAKGVRNRRFVIVSLCSALRNFGIYSIMDQINQFLPSPIDRGEIIGKNFKSGIEEYRCPEPIAPFSALVFKTIVDPYTGKLSLVRVFSGKLTNEMQILNSNKNIRERFGQLYQVIGKNQKILSVALPGDFVAISKLKETTTGDTLCDDKFPIIFSKISPSPPMISYAVTSKEKGDEEKVFSSINRLLEEDPTLHLERDFTTGEILLSGVGVIHIETTLDRLRRKFNVEVILKTPKVPYRETIKGNIRVQGRYKKQTGGRGQFGDTWMEIEPASLGDGFIFIDEIVGGAIPRNYIPAVEKGIAEAMLQGVYSGYPMVDIKVRLVDGSYHPVDSSDLAFKVAASIGFKKGISQCNPTILEPIMLLIVTVPEDVMGDVMGDISSRRGRLLGVEVIGDLQVIKAYVPMSEVLSYQPELTQITGSRGSFTLELNHYDEAPLDIQNKLVQAYQKSREENNS